MGQLMRDMRSDDDRTVTVNRVHLLEKLKENLALHIKEYDEAVAGYVSEAKETLEKELARAKAKVEVAYNRTLNELKDFDPSKASDTIVFCEAVRFNLVAPRNYSEAYEQAIEMMEWEVQEEVELTATEFRSFVMDKWDWMDQFKMSTENYTRALPSSSRRR